MRVSNRICRGCGCTDKIASIIEVGCWWVLVDLPCNTGICSTCAERAGWSWQRFASVGLDHFRDGATAHAIFEFAASLAILGGRDLMMTEEGSRP